MDTKDKIEFKRKANQTIDEIFSQIEDLEKKSRNLSDSAKKKYEEKIAELKEKKAEMKEKYEELENTADPEWIEAKKAFQQSAHSFKEGVKTLGTLFLK